jgi:hypothetical protein
MREQAPCMVDMEPVQCSGAGGIEHLPVLGMTVGAFTRVVDDDRFELQTFGEIGGDYESAADELPLVFGDQAYPACGQGTLPGRDSGRPGSFPSPASPPRSSFLRHGRPSFPAPSCR